MEMTLYVPEELAERARQAGVLSNERILDLIERELRRTQALRRFGEIIDALSQGGITEAEIEAELQARKAERLNQRSG
jgi:post-segregation antitoxin (ccd killing protein)